MSSTKTNVQVLTDLMQFSRHGALAQVFIIDAIQKHANRVAVADPAQVDSPMISGEAWVGVANEIQGTLEAHYGTGAPAAKPPRSVMLFAALLAADEVVVNDCEADRIRLTPSVRILSPVSRPSVGKSSW